LGLKPICFSSESHITIHNSKRIKIIIIIIIIIITLFVH